MLMNGCGGLTSIIVAKILRPSMAHLKARITKRCHAAEAAGQQA